jgi:hypothetical protein
MLRFIYTSDSAVRFVVYEQVLGPRQAYKWQFKIAHVNEPLIYRYLLRERSGTEVCLQVRFFSPISHCVLAIYEFAFTCKKESNLELVCLSI